MRIWTICSDVYQVVEENMFRWALGGGGQFVSICTICSDLYLEELDNPLGDVPDVYQLGVENLFRYPLGGGRQSV